MEHNIQITRRRALGASISTATIFLAGCNALNEEDDGSPDEEKSTISPGQTVTPHQPIETPTDTSDSEDAVKHTPTTETPSTTPTETPSTTPTETPSTTPTPTKEGYCQLEFSEDVMRRARTVGLEARRAVVWLRKFKDGEMIPSGGGTGWCLNDEHIVTNGHIIEGNQDHGEFHAWTINGNHYPVEVVNYISGPDYDSDLALLRLTEGSAPATLSSGDESTLTDGQPLIQIGHPVGFGRWIIALGSYTKQEHGNIVANIPSTGGNSGSPLLTLDKKVIGMHWGKTPAWDTGAPTDPTLSAELLTGYH